MTRPLWDEAKIEFVTRSLVGHFSDDAVEMEAMIHDEMLSLHHWHERRAKTLFAACEAYLQIIDMPIPNIVADANAWADKRAAAVEQMRAAVAQAKGAQ